MNNLFKIVLISMFLCIPALSLCSVIGNNETMNLTLTNSTPINEMMLIEAVTNETVGSQCYINILLHNATIEQILPEFKKDALTKENCIQTVFGDTDKLIVQDNGVMRYSLWLDPSKYISLEEYEILVECGTSCSYMTFKPDTIKFTRFEIGAINLIYSFAQDPLYLINLVFYLAMLVSFLYILIKLVKRILFKQTSIVKTRK